MMQQTTQKEQVGELSDAHRKISPNKDMGVLHTGDTASTVTTEYSREKKDFSAHPSPLFEAATDPTSIPSGISDDLDLDRKCTEPLPQTDQAIHEFDLTPRHNTESPLNSIEAVNGSDSFHSEISDSSTRDSDSRECIEAAVNPRKIKAIGDHFGDSSTETQPPRFHDPEDNLEAIYINNRVQQTHDTMDDIDLHPEEHFRDPGTSFQVSARPKEPAESALDVGGDIAPKRKVSLPTNSLRHFDIEKYNVKEPRRRKSPGCIIL